MTGRAKKKNGFNRRVARRIKELGLRAEIGRAHV